VTSKAELRQQFRSLRRLLLPAAEAELQRQANALESLLGAEQHLGLYWPLNGEADLRGMADQPNLHQRLALPRVEAGALTYRSWQPGDALSPDDTGIQSPAKGAGLQAQELGLLLAPALAFDASGIRLGYGGGWFDRLRSDPSWRNVLALAVLPAGCLVPALPRDEWDVPFNGWLDEQGLHWLQAV
jgi:5-formyltetrahydrofolate cyclo-ligase